MKRALILLALVGCHAHAEDAPEAEPPVSVTCVAAASTKVSDSVNLRGVITVPPDQQAVVAPLTAGRISEVRVREGQQVERGDVLALVDDPALVAASGEADAAVSTARAAAVAAQAGADRAERLFNEGIAARREVEDARAKLAAARADLEAARARLALATTQRERAAVKAPIAGTVVHVLRRAGELVDGTPATPLVELADLDKLELRAQVPAADLVRLAEGQAAAVKLDALPDASVAGKLVAVSPALDATTGLGAVRVSLAALPAASGTLRLGLAATAVVTLGERAATTVPIVAVRRGASGGDEVVVCAGDKAAVRAVKLGARDATDVEVREGVAAGETVVVDHVLGLDDGAAISVGAAPTTAPGAKP